MEQQCMRDNFDSTCMWEYEGTATKIDGSGNFNCFVLMARRKGYLEFLWAYRKDRYIPLNIMYTTFTINNYQET